MIRQLAQQQLGASRNPFKSDIPQRTLANRMSDGLVEHATNRLAIPLATIGQDFTQVPLHPADQKRDSKADDKVAPSGAGGPAAGPAAPTSPAPPTAPPTLAATSVTLPSHIKAASSPIGMADRIAPRVDTAVTASISGMSATSPKVVLSVEGAGGGNGNLTIDGNADASLSATSTVQLRGTTQTDVGKGGNLKLVAKQGTEILASSGGFSVTSIPENYTDAFVSLIIGSSRGFVVQDGWSSDSGTFADLDKTEISELVEYGTGTGCFAGASGGNSTYLPGNVLSKDSHSRPLSELTSEGTLVAAQVCEFKDNRSGSIDIPMKNSGYTLSRENKLKSPGKFAITTSKIGAATSAKGIASAAGSGSITKTQDD